MGDIIDFSQMKAGMSSGASGPAAQAGTGAGLSGLAGVPGSLGASAGQSGTPGLTVSSSVEPSGELRLDVRVAASQLDAAKADARLTIARSFNVDARDEAQMGRLRTEVGAEAFDALTATIVQQGYFALACKEAGVEPFLSPDIPPAELPQPGEDYVFSATMLQRPEVTISSFDPVEVQFPEKREVSSQDVSDYLDVMAEQMATYEPDYAASCVGEGAHVIVTTAMVADGQVDPSSLNRHMPYDLGTQAMPEEFDRNLLGMKVGEAKTFSMSVPVMTDPAASAPSYEMMQIQVTVEEIDRKVPVVINDAWVARNAPDAGTLLGLRAKVREALEKEADRAYHDQLADAASAEFAKRLEGGLSQAHVDRMRDQLMSSFVLELQRQGVDARAYLSQPGFDAEAFEQEMTARAEETLRTNLALDALADHLGAQVSDNDLRDMLSHLNPGHEMEELRSVRESGQLESLRELTRQAHARDWLVKNAKDTSAPHLQLL